MGATLFFFGFLAGGIIGVESMMSFEPLPSARIGASAFLYLLCLTISIISTLFFAESSRRFRRGPNWFTGLLGGVVAAGAFCTPVAAAYALGFGHSVALTLTLTLPILLGLLWPFLIARAPALPNSN
jgi:hypothetical protein